ncbi:MAG: hypothetical protein IPK60_14185 [Sandaracinaceae bacterium]|jgi:hypothetical protein|nr:hypothetical protein [Sandaracinaceae bacterium]
MGSLWAFAQSIPIRTMGIGWRASSPRLAFSARDLVNGDVAHKLQSGLPQTIVMRVYAYDQANGSPVALAPLSCRVVYDLWEEVYRVQVQTASSQGSETISTLSAVAQRCLVVRSLGLGTDAEWQARRGHTVYFASIVELNPMSADTVDRIRRWLARPQGGGRVESDAFFGSFVSIFVNRRVGAAERTLSFRSQSVEVP